MVCRHTYSIRGNRHPDGEAPSGLSDPLAFYPGISNVGLPTALSIHPFQSTTAVPGFDVAADSERFLIPVPDKPKTSQVTVILNWTALLKR